jgi:hypothetical protein
MLAFKAKGTRLIETPYTIDLTPADGRKVKARLFLGEVRVKERRGPAFIAEQAVADVELRSRGKGVKLKALVNTGASRSVISKELADRLEAFIPLDKPYELRTADEKGKLKIVGQALVEVIFQGVEVPSRVTFEVAENQGKTSN